MALDMQSAVCLDVAIDHRIIQLFKPVMYDPKEHSNHISRIKERGQSLERHHDEIEVTAQLAGPAVKGGIAVVLQQPRHNHPFEKGLDEVISDCETLRALDEVFTAVSCGTLDIRTDIAVVDLLPYTVQEPKEMEYSELRDLFSTFTETICDKEPGVVLCAGKVSLSYGSDCKGAAARFESIGVGKRFESFDKTGTVGLRYGEREVRVPPRVNGFHPSYAMNFNPNVSLFRQLQILIAAETCGILRDDWKEEKWMDNLRVKCKTISKEALFSSTLSQRSPELSTRRSGTKYLPNYQGLYSNTLLALQASIKLLHQAQRQVKLSPERLYDSLLSQNLSRECNDASLLLRKMSELKSNGWPAYVAEANKAALATATDATLSFADKIREAMEHSTDMQLAEIIRKSATSIEKCVTEEELNLIDACDVFLTMAKEIESLLSDLLRDKRALDAQRQEEAQSPEEALLNMLGSMSLAPKH